MKSKLKTFLVILVACTMMVACSGKTIVVKQKSTPAKSTPPGQAKKVSGSNSAKSFAPGQQKKKK